MKRSLALLRLTAACVLLIFASAGCESTDSGGSVSSSVYFGVGVYDPWYYGDDWDDVDIIVTPPDRPDAPPRPTHPIASPPSVSPRPMPSIPSAPRASFRR